MAKGDEVRNPVNAVRDRLLPPAPRREGPVVRSVVPLALEAGEDLTKATLLLHRATLGDAEESERLALARAALAAQELQEQLAAEPDAPPTRWRPRSRSRLRVIDLRDRPRLPSARDGGPRAAQRPDPGTDERTGQRAMPTD